MPRLQHRSAAAFLFLTLSFFLLASANAQNIGGKDTSAKSEVTYSKDVAPILQKHCAACHRPNDVAPMSLLTYDEVLPFARMIRERVIQRKMPPWHADAAFGEFVNDARMSEAEIATIDAWVKNGTKRGEVVASSAEPALAPGWHIKPDVILTIPEFMVSKGAQDDYEYIYVPTNFTEDKWIQAAEVLPGDRRVVHHATVSVIDQSEVAKHLAEHAKADEGVDQYHYRTGKVLHLRPDAPVIDDGCAAPDGGGVPGQPSGYLNIVPALRPRACPARDRSIRNLEQHVSHPLKRRQPPRDFLLRLAERCDCACLHRPHAFPRQKYVDQGHLSGRPRRSAALRSGL